MVCNAKCGYPVVLLGELVVRELRIKLPEHIKTQRERQQRENEGRIPNRAFFALHEYEERADQRQENPSCEQAPGPRPVTRNEQWAPIPHCRRQATDAWFRA